MNLNPNSNPTSGFDLCAQAGLCILPFQGLGLPWYVRCSSSEVRPLRTISLHFCVSEHRIGGACLLCMLLRFFFGSSLIHVDQLRRSSLILAVYSCMMFCIRKYRGGPLLNCGGFIVCSLWPRAQEPRTPRAHTHAHTRARTHTHTVTHSHTLTYTLTPTEHTDAQCAIGEGTPYRRAHPRNPSTENRTPLSGEQANWGDSTNLPGHKQRCTSRPLVRAKPGPAKDHGKLYPGPWQQPATNGLVHSTRGCHLPSRGAPHLKPQG